MRPIVLACAFGGLVLLATLVFSSSPSAVMAILATSTGPLAAAIAYRAVPSSLYALSWQALIPTANRPKLWILLRLRWIGESMNALLPVAQIGGDVARARLLSQNGVPAATATAAMVADLGVGAATQVTFTLTGAIIFSLHGALGALSHAVMFVCIVMAAAAAGVIVVARVGIDRIIRLFPFLKRARNSPRARALLAQAVHVDQALAAVGARRGVLARAIFLHLVGWFLQAFETWLILRLIGSGISWTGAVVIESLALAARSAAFLVPGGLGVQEGALILLCAPFGIDRPMALSLGIIKRIREVLVGAPAIIAWSIAERQLLDRIWRRATRREGREGDGS
jgi:putative membrane protein